MFAACETKTGADTKKDSTATTNADAEVKLDYPYTIEHPDGWDIGDPANSVMVLKSLKAYEMGNLDEAMQYFADSVQVNFDRYEAKLLKDSLKAMFAQTHKDLKGMRVKMYDWESVISKDKKEQYVSMWWQQSWDGKNGRDSISVMDDVKIENGKIIEIDEKLRHYAATKK